MTDTDLLHASDLMRAEPTWTLFTHLNADGDALGSASAVFEAGLLSGKRVVWFGPDAEPPAAYSFLPHVADYRRWDAAAPGPEGLHIFLDCSNPARSVPEACGARTLNIDHHEDNSLFGSENCVDPLSSSTAELVFRILKAGSWSLSKTIAESLYVGIWTDSGGFSFSNTSPRTHRLAAELLELGAEPDRLNDLISQNRTAEGMALWGRALTHIRLFGPENVFALAWLSQEDFASTGARAADTEGLPSFLMRLRGVRLATLLTDRGEAGVRASFRSREGIFEAADAARSLGGGGHPRAAGATLDGSLETWLADIPRILEARYAEWSVAS